MEDEGDIVGTVTRQPQGFQQILTLQSVDIASKSSCCERMLDDSPLSCLVHTPLSCCCHSYNVPVTVEVMRGDQPKNTIMRVNHVLPFLECDALIFCEQVVVGQQSLMSFVRQLCPMCFETDNHISYAFVVGDVSAVDSVKYDNSCIGPCKKICCWCFPDQTVSMLKVHMQGLAGGRSEVKLAWIDNTVPVFHQGEYQHLLDHKSNAANTLQNLIMHLRTDSALTWPKMG